MTTQLKMSLPSHELDIKAEAFLTDEQAVEVLSSMAVEEELQRGVGKISRALRKACNCIRTRSSQQMTYSVHDGKESDLFP